MTVIGMVSPRLVAQTFVTDTFATETFVREHVSGLDDAGTPKRKFI